MPCPSGGLASLRRREKVAKGYLLSRLEPLKPGAPVSGTHCLAGDEHTPVAVALLHRSR